jgi:YidC/Oxa1 family membrane protein insertase
MGLAVPGRSLVCDHFLYEFDQPYKLFNWVNLTGLNLLPILMGAIFWVQQKYMTPQMANMSPEQKQMQTMMRIMTVFLFPIMLYTAPSGLTLYIMTSSIWGILESRHVRKHVEKMEIEKPIERKSMEERMAMKAKTRGKDPYSRAMQFAMDRAKAKREAKEKKTFKKRK